MAASSWDACAEKHVMRRCRAPCSVLDRMGSLTAGSRKSQSCGQSTFRLAGGSKVSAVDGSVTKKRSSDATRHIERRDAPCSRGSKSLKPTPGWTSSGRSNPIRGSGRTG